MAIMDGNTQLVSKLRIRLSYVEMQRHHVTDCTTRYVRFAVLLRIGGNTTWHWTVARDRCYFQLNFHSNVTKSKEIRLVDYNLIALIQLYACRKLVVGMWFANSFILFILYSITAIINGINKLAKPVTSYKQLFPEMLNIFF